jgi:hypothetical protein
MATINRKSYSSTMPADQQPGIFKAIVVNTTMRGYLHLVAVRTSFDANNTPKEAFIDVLVHPDRAMTIDVQKFDAISVQGMSPRQAPGEARLNTQYVWANGINAFGKHLVKRTTENQLMYDGIGIYELTDTTGLQVEELEAASELI